MKSDYKSNFSNHNNIFCELRWYLATPSPALQFTTYASYKSEKPKTTYSIAQETNLY